MWEHLGIAPADILLPQCDLTKWSVIACDQHTAEADYWQRVEQTVGSAPSSLRLILPEVQLEGDVEQRVAEINATMTHYLETGLFASLPQTMLYVERQVSSGAVRRGLVCCVDLEEYDFHPDSQSMIRATERTVLERIPPRMRIRENAPLELPHIMVLVDDRRCPLLAPLAQEKARFEKKYGFELMEQGGRIDGWCVDAPALMRIAETLGELRQNTPLLFAVGDGNHSLAAAKTIYERDKAHTPPEEWVQLPSRWALAELVSLEDAGVEFLPIHRIVLGVDPENLREAFLRRYPSAVFGEGEGQVFRWCSGESCESITVRQPEYDLAAETLQNFLDEYTAVHDGRIDYIHEAPLVQEVGRLADAVGILLPDFPREALFPYVEKHGTLPRKTFSIGHSNDKRYYLEGRALKR